MPRHEEPPDRSVLTTEIQSLAARLQRRGFKFDAMSHSAQAMAQNGRVDDLETAALEGVRDELQAFYRTIMARETQAAGRIKNLRHSVWAAAVAALLAGGAVQKFFDPIGKLAQAAKAMSHADSPNPKAAPVQNPTPSPPTSQRQPPPSAKPPSPPAPEKPKGPDFLNEQNIKLHGLALLVQNNDQFDRYIFNAMTGVRNFAQTYGIQGGYPFEFSDGRTYTMPYHAVLFKPCDERSNVRLPPRFGANKQGATIADIINGATRYHARDEAEIKTIVVTSFELSFGVKIDPAHIQIVPRSDGKVAAIKYTGPNPKQLVGETSTATATEPDDKNPERRNITASKEERWYLVDGEGNLVFPPTTYSEQGIAIPIAALPRIDRVNYTKTFSSQGREISVRINIPIDSVLEEQDRLQKKREPKTIQIDDATETSSYSWYVVDNDPVLTQIAHQITDSFETPEEKMQAILDFVHTFHYVPDAYGEAPRTARTSLISLGGDCEDSSILVLNLARSVGLECVFLYLHEHASLACDVGGPGSAFAWGGRRYEWAETTGDVTTQDQFGRVVEKRAWRVGERPPENRAIRWIQRVGGPLQTMRE